MVCVFVCQPRTQRVGLGKWEIEEEMRKRALSSHVAQVSNKQGCDFSQGDGQAVLHRIRGMDHGSAYVFPTAHSVRLS
jgi:hypothetical protein